MMLRFSSCGLTPLYRLLHAMEHIGVLERHLAGLSPAAGLIATSNYSSLVRLQATVKMAQMWSFRTL
jgi:hypothetical protein